MTIKQLPPKSSQERYDDLWQRVRDLIRDVPTVVNFTVPWAPAWQGNANYVVDQVVRNGAPAQLYNALVEHESDPQNEPGVGIFWEMFWELVGPAGFPAKLNDARINSQSYVQLVALNLSAGGVENIRITPEEGACVVDGVVGSAALDNLEFRAIIV